MTPQDNRGHGETLQDCQAIERLLVYYACEDATPEERATVERHVGGCTNCAAMLAAELRLRQMLATVAQPADGLDPAGVLLAQCRSELAEALDDARDSLTAARMGLAPQGLFARWLAWCRMELAIHPALGAAFFVVLGLAVGRMAPATNGGFQQAGLVPTMTVSASPRISDQELQNMSVSEIYLVPGGDAGAQNVEVHLRAMTPRVVSGGPDDTEVKRVLGFVIQNSQRFESDTRMDSVEALRTRTDDADVRRLLCLSLRHDPNPGVRLKAMEALHGFDQDANVLNAVLDALMHDSNPGVRNEAVDELRATVDAGNASGDPQIARVLRDLSERDPNNYIRLQAAAAVRQLSSGPLK
jgi:hypothetical protein